MKNKTVCHSVVYSRNFISDWIMGLKNILGGRLKGYEDMLNTGTKTAIQEFNNKYPKAKNIRMQITEFRDASICISVYGVINGK